MRRNDRAGRPGGAVERWMSATSGCAGGAALRPATSVTPSSAARFITGCNRSSGDGQRGLHTVAVKATTAVSVGRKQNPRASTVRSTSRCRQWITAGTSSG